MWVLIVNKSMLNTTHIVCITNCRLLVNPTISVEIKPGSLPTFKSSKQFSQTANSLAQSEKIQLQEVRRHASTHTPHHSFHCKTFLMWSWVPIFPQTHLISWGSAHERGCGVPVSSYKHTLQTVMKQVHPNWECLTRKHLNQLLNKRVHPLPSPHHLNRTLSPQPTPLLLPSLWDLMEEIHLCHLVACLLSANCSK